MGTSNSPDAARFSTMLTRTSVRRPSGATALARPGRCPSCRPGDGLAGRAGGSSGRERQAESEKEQRL